MMPESQTIRLSADLAPVGGRLKKIPEHFVVEELPLYEPSGQGPHLYLKIRRRGLSTREMLEELARRFKVKAADIGYAGLKDKEAVSSQFFSLPLPTPPEQVKELCQDAPWRIELLSRHQNKLKVGHLLGNRFSVIISEPSGSLAEAQAIAQRLRESGVPNYFGLQRFGRQGDNFQAGLALLKAGRRARGWRDKFLLSSLQSFIYNHYLSLRIHKGLFLTVLEGDICKKYATGGLFCSEDPATDSERLLAGELSHCGPLFGAKTLAAKGPAASLEAEVLERLSLSPDQLAGCGVGDRRPNRLLLNDLELWPEPQGLGLSFSLPKGAYATVVLAEFIGPEAAESGQAPEPA